LILNFICYLFLDCNVRFLICFLFLDGKVWFLICCIFFYCKVCFLFLEGKVWFDTFPRNYNVNIHDVEGHRTFPRASNMVQRRPELGSTLLSRGSSGALSNSSSSSGFPPDPDMDSPEGRLNIKRNSDIDSPVFNPVSDLAFSKCKYSTSLCMLQPSGPTYVLVIYMGGNICSYATAFWTKLYLGMGGNICSHAAAFWTKLYFGVGGNICSHFINHAFFLQWYRKVIKHTSKVLVTSFP
jgi:hypothetical protein